MLSRHVFRRCLSTGVAIDIDGVVTLGRRAVPGAARALSRLRESGIPFVFLTNGGGVTEGKKAQQLTKILSADDPSLFFGNRLDDENENGIVDDERDMSISKDQIILSHSPMKEVAERHADSVVLLVGEGDLLSVAKEYGFSRAILACEYARLHRELYPFQGRVIDEIRRGRTTDELERVFERFEPVSAVLTMHDPLFSMRDAQLICDVARSWNGVPGAKPDGPPSPAEVHFSNPDMLFSGEFSWPRFGQGAFRVSVEAMFKGLQDSVPPEQIEDIAAAEAQFDTNSNKSLLNIDPRRDWVQHGKPTAGTFAFARKTLDARASALGVNHLDSIFMIGDNPAADIKGANNAGDPWKSIFVRTGKIAPRPESLTGDHKPHHIVDDISTAVDLIIEHAKQN